MFEVFDEAAGCLKALLDGEACCLIPEHAINDITQINTNTQIGNIQVHLKKFEYHRKVQYFLSLISESETHILYIFITQSEIFQAFISLNFEFCLTDNENPEFGVSEN